MDLARLNNVIDSLGIKKTVIARELGISIVSLKNKLTGKTEFSSREIIKLSRLLHLTDKEKLDIFLP